MTLDYMAENFILWLPTIIVFVECVLLPIIWKIAELKTHKKIADIHKKLDELAEQNKALNVENVLLKKKLNQTLTKMDHIHRED